MVYVYELSASKSFWNKKMFNEKTDSKKGVRASEGFQTFSGSLVERTFCFSP